MQKLEIRSISKTLFNTLELTHTVVNVILNTRKVAGSKVNYNHVLTFAFMFGHNGNLELQHTTCKVLEDSPRRQKFSRRDTSKRLKSAGNRFMDQVNENQRRFQSTQVLGADFAVSDGKGHMHKTVQLK